LNPDYSKTVSEIQCVAQKLLEKNGANHDIYHALRVEKNAKKILKKEGGDELVVLAASLLHDIFRYREKEGISHYGEEALSEIKKLLEKTSIPKQKIPLVLNCIKTHEEYVFSGFGKPKTKEEQILQDADRLDALGAIGIARCLHYSGELKEPIYLPGTKIGKYNPRILGTKSSITHFYEKLLKLENSMNTNAGKKMAKERTKFMKNYLEQFFAEWNGKK
jgi:uncharacterized protein